MNKLRSLVLVTLRGYHGRGRARETRDTVRKTGLSEQELYPDVNDYDEPDEHEFDDVEKDEADFADADQTYREYMSEQHQQKKKLKTQIIARKYFKPDDPNFLTWTEKVQIQSLHAKDPVEWSPERLSESFPALPDTIRRILRAHWKPRNVQTVIKYDAKVIDNWSKFKSRNIAVSPKLEAHLQQFKGRKIEAADMETILEKFVKQKSVFPEPKATLFSSIVQGFVETPKESESVPRLSDGKKVSLVNFSKLNIAHERVNFDDFMKATVANISRTDNLSPEVQLLVEEYKKKQEDESFEISGTSEPKIEEVNIENTERRVFSEEKEKINTPKDADDSRKMQSSDECHARNNQILERKNLEKPNEMDSLKRKKSGKPVMMGKSPQDLESLGTKFSDDEEVLISGDGDENFEMSEENPSEFQRNLKTKEKLSRSRMKSRGEEMISSGVDNKNVQTRGENHSEFQLEPRKEEMKEVGEVKKGDCIYVDIPKLNLDDDRMATGIIEWKKKEVSGPDDYPRFIKIPKKKAQTQISFRVQDRYYDCDGEFLYRVPGLKSL